MSFLKITDPAKRDLIVKEYLETKTNIRDNLLTEKTGEQVMQTELSKFFKPITETQKATTNEITEGLKPIKEGIEQLPQQQSVPEEEGLTLLDKKCNSILNKKRGKIDETFGIEKIGNDYYMGNKLVDHDGAYIIIDGKRYTSTDGLWELITSKNPDEKKYNINDHAIYDEILKATDVIHSGNNPNNPHPKSSKGQTWKELVGPLWNSIQKAKEYEGEGIVILVTLTH